MTVILVIYLRGKHMAILDTRSGKRMVLMTFVALFVHACDSVLYLSLNAPGAGFKKVYVEAHEALRLESDSVDISIHAGLVSGSLKKNRTSEILVVDMEITSNYDFKLNISEAFLLDSAGQRLFPQADSKFKKDGNYEMKKKHNLGIVFHARYPDHPIIKLPAILGLPPLVFIASNDSLRLGKIEIH
jgi:hypothetical protein